MDGAGEMPDDLPIACTLSNADFRKREATVLAEFKSALIATEELADGYGFRIPGDRKWLAVVTELISAERECCPFLKFELIADSNMGPLMLRITGPAGTKEFLKSILA